MVIKEVKEKDPEYYTLRAIKKKFRPLFSSARTRESKDVDASKDCKQTIEKEEKEKFGFAEFDAPKEEY